MSKFDAGLLLIHHVCVCVCLCSEVSVCRTITAAASMRVCVCARKTSVGPAALAYCLCAHGCRYHRRAHLLIIITPISTHIHTCCEQVLRTYSGTGQSRFFKKGARTHRHTHTSHTLRSHIHTSHTQGQGRVLTLWRVSSFERSWAMVAVK